jgi:hypothetical protein
MYQKLLKVTSTDLRSPSKTRSYIEDDESLRAKEKVKKEKFYFRKKNMKRK